MTVIVIIATRFVSGLAAGAEAADVVEFAGNGGIGFKLIDYCVFPRFSGLGFVQMNVIKDWGKLVRSCRSDFGTI